MFANAAASIGAKKTEHNPYILKPTEDIDNEIMFITCFAGGRLSMAKK
jgi:hypothetical protein